MANVWMALAGLLTALVVFALIRLIGKRDSHSADARLVLAAGTAGLLQSIVGSLYALRLWDEATAAVLGAAGVVTSGATISFMTHFSFHFPKRLPLPRLAMPVVYIPLFYSAAAAPFVYDPRGAPLPALLLTALVFFGFTLFMIANMLRARRLASSPADRARVIPIVTGITLTLVVALIGFVVPAAAGLSAEPGSEGFVLLPAYLGIAYAMLKYGLFDLELLRRRIAVGAVCALLGAATVALPLVLVAAIVAPGPELLLPLACLLGGAVGFGSWSFQALATRVVERLAPSLKWQEGKPVEAFVIHRSGVVLAHRRAPGGAESVDADVLGGMIAAVQEFVRDSFSAADPGKLRTMNLGSVKLLLEHGKDVMVAVVFSGYETDEMRDEVARIVARIETEHGRALSGWKGSTTGLEGIEEMLVLLWPAPGSAIPDRAPPSLPPSTRDLALGEGVRLH